MLYRDTYLIILVTFELICKRISLLGSFTLKRVDAILSVLILLFSRSQSSFVRRLVSCTAFYLMRLMKCTFEFKTYQEKHASLFHVCHFDDCYESRMHCVNVFRLKKGFKNVLSIGVHLT